MMNTPKKTFTNYVNKSDLNKGKVLPLDLNTNENTLRMRLENKELLVHIEDCVELSFLDKETDKVFKEIGKTKNKEELNDLFEKVKSLTIPKYHYSLDNLKESIQ